MMSNRRVGTRDNRQRVDDEVTPERAARVRRLKRRLSWQRRFAAVVPAAVLSLLLAVGAVGAVGAVRSTTLPVAAATTGSGTGWAVRVCATGDCTRSTATATLSPRQFTTSSLVLSGQPSAATRKTQVTMTVNSTSSGTTASGTALRTVIVRAHQAVHTTLATLPSLFAETGATTRVATTYTITVSTQGMVVGHAIVTLTR